MSGNEFGGYNPTPTLAGSSNGNTSKPNPKRQAVNGAGGKAGGKPIKRQKASPIEEQDADGDYASEAEGEGDAPDKDRDGEVVPTQRNATRKEPIKVNGKKLTGAMKGKGKAKVADPSPKPNGTTNPRSKKDKDVDVLEVDDDDEEDGAEEDIDQPSGKNTARKSNNTTVSSSVSTRQMEKLKKHNEELQAHLQKLQRQMEECLRIRNTEAEELMKQREEHYEQQLQAQNNLIEQFKEMVEKKEPLLRPGKAHLFNLITRETADEEKRALERDLRRLKELAEDREAKSKIKDERIAELETIERELQYELRMERERSTSLAAKASKLSTHQPPGSDQRGRTALGAVEDPKKGQLVRFYEDLTNLLVTNVKPAGPAEDPNDVAWIFDCIYSYPMDDESYGDHIKDLHFTLRFDTDQPSPPNLGDDPGNTSHQSSASGVPVVHYTPLDLDKEKPELSARLGFLAAGFTFGRNQLPLFLRTMHDNVNGKNTIDDDGASMGGDEGDDDDASIVEMDGPPQQQQPMIAKKQRQHQREIVELD